MNTTGYTPEVILTMIGNLTESQKETDRILRENEVQIKELTENMNKDSEKTVQAIQELKESQKATDLQIKELTENVKNLNNDLGGMQNSNGSFAEEYFFNAFANGQRTFFGETFDNIEKKLKGIEIGYKTDYDIVLLNGKTVAIIEVKYKGKLKHISKVIDKADSFRINYPKYVNHQIYLAFAAMSFDEDDYVEEKIKKKGIAVVKQMGDVVVINDKNMTAF
jgi:DNA-binding transcriptional MerR regulator